MANSPELTVAELERRFKRLALRLPAIAGNEVVNFTLDNFKRQGFMGDTFQKWRPRKNPTKWGTVPKRNGRAIGVDTARLRRGTRIVKADWNEVIIGNDAPYAKAFNEGSRLGVIQQVGSFRRKIKGVTQQVTAHTRRINQNQPARPFLATSAYLTKRIERVIGAEILKELT